MTKPALKLDFVFRYSSPKMRTRVMGRMIFRRSFTRSMFSYCPLHATE